MKTLWFLLFFLSASAVALEMEYTISKKGDLHEVIINAEDDHSADTMPESIYYLAEIHSFNICMKENKRVPEIKMQKSNPPSGSVIELHRHFECIKADKEVVNWVKENNLLICKLEKAHPDIKELCTRVKPYLNSK